VLFAIGLSIAPRSSTLRTARVPAAASYATECRRRRPPWGGGRNTRDWRTTRFLIA